MTNCFPDFRLPFQYNGKNYLVFPGQIDKDVKLPDGTLLRLTADGKNWGAKVTSITKLDQPSGKGIVEAQEGVKRGAAAPPGAMY